MPDIGDQQSLPRLTEQEIAFDNSAKISANSPFTKTIDFKGCNNVIVIQSATQQLPDTMTLFSSTGWASINSTFDKNIATGTDLAQLTGGNGCPASALREAIYDMGSSAVRKMTARMAVRANTTSGSTATATGFLEFSNSSSGPWVERVTIVTVTSVGVADQTVTQTTQANPPSAFRYVRASGVLSGVSGSLACGQVQLFEIWESDTGFGTSTLSFEIFDTVRSVWRTYIPTTEFTTQDSGPASGTTETKEIGMNKVLATTPPQRNYFIPSFPTTPTPRIRARLDVIGKVDTSVILWKVFS